MFYKIQSKNIYVLIDKEDLDKIKGYKWYLQKVKHCKYAVSKKPTIYMHRLIMGQDNPLGIDHINGNGLDNRKKNLRFCSQSANMRNAKKYEAQTKITLTSQYKGVYWKKDDKIWRASISIKGRCKSLGNFKNEKKAAIAYDNYVKKYFPEYCKINF